METVGGKGKVLRGMKGVMSIGTGAEQEVHPWEDIEFQPEGIYLHHYDAYGTITFFPMYTLRQMRLHQAEMERQGPNTARGEIAYKKANPPKSLRYDHELPPEPRSLNAPDLRQQQLPPSSEATDRDEDDEDDEKDDDRISHA